MRKLFTMMGLGLVLSIPAFAQGTLGTGDLTNGDQESLDVTATIGAYTVVDALDLNINFAGTDAVEPMSGDAAPAWFASEADTDFGVAAQDTANDGQAHLKLRTNRRLQMDVETGQDLLGVNYDDVLQTRFDLKVTGRAAVLAATSTTTSATYPVAAATINDIPAYAPDADAVPGTNSFIIGIERAMSDAPVFDTYVRAEIERKGLLDAMDTYNQDDQPVVVSLWEAKANGARGND